MPFRINNDHPTSPCFCEIHMRVGWSHWGHIWLISLSTKVTRTYFKSPCKEILINHCLQFWNWHQFSGGFREAQKCATNPPPPSGPSCFIFMQFLTKAWPNNRLVASPSRRSRRLRPFPSGKSLFSHCNWRFPWERFLYFLSVPAQKLVEGKYAQKNGGYHNDDWIITN